MGCEKCGKCISEFLNTEFSLGKNISPIEICLHKRYIGECSKELNERVGLPMMREILYGLSNPLSKSH